MLKSLKNVTDRLVDYYKPDRIILFGSYGRKEFEKGSDIDLLIIKQTDKRPLERQIEIERLLADRSIPLDIIVYTPEEVRYLYSIGSPFIEEIVGKGRVIYMRKVTDAWIKDAEDELESAEILCEHGKYRGACCHSQQCIEKGLKAFILEKWKRPERIHDIVELHNAVTSLGFDTGLSMDDAVFLNSIYKGRHPTDQGLLPHGEPAQADAEKAVSVARILVERLKSQIRIRIEAEAVLSIIELIEEGRLALITSSVVEFELKKTPDPERISFGSKVISLHSERITLSNKIVKRAKEFEKRNIKAIDALHLAIADIEKIDYLCTCDDRFHKSAKKIKNLNTKIVSPIEFIEEYGNDYDNK